MLDTSMSGNAYCRMRKCMSDLLYLVLMDDVVCSNRREHKLSDCRISTASRAPTRFVRSGRCCSTAASSISIRCCGKGMSTLGLWLATSFRRHPNINCCRGNPVNMHAELVCLIVLVVLVGVLLVFVLVLTATGAVAPLRITTMPASAPFLLPDEVVVARYGEDLSWLSQKPWNVLLPRAVIYNKGPQPIDPQIAARCRKVVQLPNLGRCDHTYLHHVVLGIHTNTLAGTTLFLPGSAFELPHKRSTMECLLHGKKPKYTKVHLPKDFEHFNLNTWVASSVHNAKINPEAHLEPSLPRPFGKWFQAVFGQDLSVRAELMDGGVFWGTAEGIRTTPLPVYHKLLLQTEVGSNPEVGHYIERVWGFLVSAKPTAITNKINTHVLATTTTISMV